MARKKSLTQVLTKIDIRKLVPEKILKRIFVPSKSIAEFYKIPKWLFCRKDFSPSHKLIYAILYNFARDTGIAFPSLSTLEAESGISKSTIRRVINDLISKELIVIGKMKGYEKNFYFLLKHPYMDEFDGSLDNPIISVNMLEIQDKDDLDLEEESSIQNEHSISNMNTDDYIQSETEVDYDVNLNTSEGSQNEPSVSKMKTEGIQNEHTPYPKQTPKRNKIKENIKENNYILCENFSPDQPETEFTPKPDKATDKPSHKTKDKKFSLDAMIKKMEKDKRKHINIIASLIKYTNPEIENKEQLRAYVTRHSRSAKQLEGFDLFKIEAVMEWLNNKCQEWEDQHWTLETVLKYIFEFEGKKENKTIKEKLEPDPPKKQQANLDKKPQSQPFDPIKYGRRMARQRWARLHPEEARELYDMEANASWDAKNELSPEEIKQKIQLAHYKFAQKYPDLANELMQMEREEVLKAMGNSSNDNKVDSGAFRRYLESRGMAKSKGQPQKISEILQGGSDEEQEDELPF